MSDPVARSTRWWRKLPLLLGLIAFAALLLFARDSRPADKLQQALHWIASSGWVGMILFVLLYIAACILFLPGSVLTIGAGTIFGLGKGIVLSSISSTLGATAAFLVGRYLARDWVARRLERFPRFHAIDEAVAADGWKIVGLTRLSPVFPFSLLNYAYGLTGVSLRHYFFASWIGMLPGTVLYVYLGSLVRDLAAGTTRNERSAAEWVFYGVGLAATVVVSWWITRIARKALAARV